MQKKQFGDGDVCMVMCCAREILEELCKVFLKSAAIIQRDSVVRNANLVQKRN